LLRFGLGRRRLGRLGTGVGVVEESDDRLGEGVPLGFMVRLATIRLSYRFAIIIIIIIISLCMIIYYYFIY
jgi:hypothetical protein